MRRVEFWRWMIPGHTGKLHRSTWDMTETEAQARYPGCQRVPGTLVVRDLPETEDEAFRVTTTGATRQGSFSGPPVAPAAAAEPPPSPADPASA